MLGFVGACFALTLGMNDRGVGLLITGERKYRTVSVRRKVWEEYQYLRFGDLLRSAVVRTTIQ